MTEYTHAAHAVYALEYHIVLVVKYRKPCLTGEVAEACKRECTRILEHYEGKVIQMETDVDHIHIYGETIRKYLWKDSFWSDSYFIATSGGVTLETLKKYVEEQGRPKRHYRKHKKADSSPAK